MTDEAKILRRAFYKCPNCRALRGMATIVLSLRDKSQLLWRRSFSWVVVIVVLPLNDLHHGTGWWVFMRNLKFEHQTRREMRIRVYCLSRRKA